MVFAVPQLDKLGPWTGLVFLRTGKYKFLLCLELLIGLTVTLTNLLLISILIMGRKKLMKNPFYIIFANLIIFTSLKGFVEVAFISPYYILQSDGISMENGYFSTNYEFVIFNISILADYGVLFFSLLIVVNRYLAVSHLSTNLTTTRTPSKVQTCLSCIFVWLCSAIIPFLFYFFECQFKYLENASPFIKQYVNHCSKVQDDKTMALFNCLVYLSYACALVVFLLYLLIFFSLRRVNELRVINKRRRRQMSLVAKSDNVTQLRLLHQSAVVFVLYAASILCVFALHFAQPDTDTAAYDISYAENLLNLSIAAAYPICFLVMSTEMRKVLLNRLTTRSSDRVSSLGSDPIT